MPTPDSWYMQTIANRTTGLVAFAARAGLCAASWGYRLAIGIRNRGYDNRGPNAFPPVPVISVGNITAGGTGKTPFVAMLFDRLKSKNRNPAILIRGYRAPDGQHGDETLELKELTGTDRIVQNPDRLAGADTAIRKLNADALILDDGFQHRRIGRHLDIVLIDATNPFGYGHLLPRGLLREPVTNLSRTDLIVITRSDLVSATERIALMDRIASVAPTVPIIRSVHRPIGLVTLAGEVLPLPDRASEPPSRSDRVPQSERLPRRAICLAGIGNPAAFEATLTALGVEVVGRRFLADHHDYTVADVADVCQLAVGHGVTSILTTCKDLVKLRQLGSECPKDMLALQIGIELEGDGGTILDALLDQALDAGSPG